MGKKIEVVELPISELKDSLGNPRRITTKKKKELQKSLKEFGDFGVIVIDEDNNIISGHQRVEAIYATKGNDPKVLCKRLVGYTEPEKRAINIKANTHAGDWDVDKLAEWTADLQVPLSIPRKIKDPAQEVKIRKMELIPYEKYDYVMIFCRNSIDYENLVKALGIEGKKVDLVTNKGGGKRRINARAIWYDEMPVVFTPKKK